MLFFLSKKYFGSRNCMIEIKATLEHSKPIVLVQEQQEDKGGGPLDTLQAECRDDKLRASIFNGRTPIVWHRISHFQNLSLKLIAADMIRSGPKYNSVVSQQEESNTLILPGEVNVSEFSLPLPQPCVVWCSAGNPGAARIAEELITSMAKNGAKLHVVDSQSGVMPQAIDDNQEPAFMLLYLNKDTWVERGEELERDVRAARESQTIKMVLVHEQDKEKGGCEFGDFFGTTPQELINDGIYRFDSVDCILCRFWFGSVDCLRIEPPRCVLTTDRAMSGALPMWQ